MNSHTPEGERLSKRVMQLRGCSRREAEQYIEGGWVSVDGVVVEEPQSRVSTQTVTLDSQASLMNLSAITLIVNKPAGWLDGLQEVQGGRKSAPQTVRSLLDAEHRSVYDASGVRLLKRHFHALEASVPLETGASGLVVFTQDFRTQRKLVEDIAFMEHELVIDVRGEVFADDLRPIERALKDERLRLPFAKVSVGSATPERSKLRLAVKGAHPGFAAYLCGLAKLEILALRRIRLGGVSLSDLDEGTWRYLAPGERF